MATWFGWAGELLGILNFPASNENERFLNEWAKAQPTDCKNNPLQANASWSGATACGEASKNYPTQNAGLQATAKQLHETRFSAILAALKSGNPFVTKGASAVANQLDTWGATTYAPTFRNESGVSGGGAKLDTTQALKGWDSIRKSFNKTRKHQLGQAHELDKAALRSLNRASKVRL